MQRIDFPTASVSTLRHLPDVRHISEGLGEAYQRYRLELRKFFELNSRNAHTVDDLMQTLYLQLMKERVDADLRDPRRYLFRMAWNVLHSAYRSEQREKRRNIPLDPSELEGPTDRSMMLWLEDDASTAVQQEELNRVLMQLPRTCQVALLRQYRDNRTYKEIAEELGVTTHAVKKYIVRGLNQFRRHFNLTQRDDEQNGKRS